MIEDPLQLTHGDWVSIQEASGAKSVFFNEGEALTTFGEPVNAFFLVEEGECRISRDTGFFIIKTGEVIGELSLLLGTRASATVMASPGGAKVMAFDSAGIKRLCEKDPMIAGKFYKFLAQKILERFLSREKVMLEPPQPPPNVRRPAPSREGGASPRGALHSPARGGAERGRGGRARGNFLCAGRGGRGASVSGGQPGVSSPPMPTH